jgi:regulator of sigma E protease
MAFKDDENWIRPLRPSIRTYSEHSLATRAAVVIAGPIASILLGFLVIYVHALVFKLVVSPAVVDVREGSPAERAGIRNGDRIVEIDGISIRSFAELQQTENHSRGQRLAITVLRETGRMTLQVLPEQKMLTDRFGNRIKVWIIGVSTSAPPERTFSNSPIEALSSALFDLHRWWNGFVALFYVDESDAEHTLGPIRIAELSAAKVFRPTTIEEFMRILGGSSILFGLYMVFPITPISDGIHLLAIMSQALARKPSSGSFQERFVRGWLAALSAVGLIATAFALPGSVAIVRGWISSGIFP